MGDGEFKLNRPKLEDFKVNYDGCHDYLIYNYNSELEKYVDFLENVINSILIDSHSCPPSSYPFMDELKCTKNCKECWYEYIQERTKEK